MKCEFSAAWYESASRSQFGTALAPSQPHEPDGWGVIQSLIDIGKDSIMADMRLNFGNAIAEGKQGIIGGENDVSATLEDGFVEIENDYLDDFIIHMDPAEFLRLLDWRIAIIESDDYKNPDAVFESIEVEYEAIPNE